MGDGYIDQLLDLGALGLFATFLIWQFIKMQDRLDKLVQDFQEQIREIDSTYERRVETMRERYDIVIQKYDGERRLLSERLGHSVEDSHDKLDRALAKLDEGLREMRAHYRRGEGVDK